MSDLLNTILTILINLPILAILFMPAIALLPRYW